MNNFIPESSDREVPLPIAPAALPRNLPPGSEPTSFRRLEDRQFLEMHRAFVRNGGLASGDDVARRLRRRAEQPISTIARWIVDRRIVSFDWQSQTLIPLFQFELQDMSLSGDVTKVLIELKYVFDSWETAAWFAQPNAWLGGASPVDAIRLKPFDVLHAARADRFVALG